VLAREVSGLAIVSRENEPIDEDAIDVKNFNELADTMVVEKINGNEDANGVEETTEVNGTGEDDDNYGMETAIKVNDTSGVVDMAGLGNAVSVCLTI
jgi:hypothetical protein